MGRTLRQVMLAAVLFGAGVLVGSLGAGKASIFRLSIDAPRGDTTIKCDGCEFLSWTDGHATERRRAISVACADGRCSQTVGAVIVETSKPQLVASAAER
jgi:hypothetical protein